MKKILLGMMFALFAVTAHAQKPGGINEGGADMVPMTYNDFMRFAEKGGPTEEEVGDADSFGRAQTYLGVAQTNPVTIQADCSGAGPGQVCIEHAAAPGTTVVDEADLGMIELPKNATNSFLCFTYTQFSTWFWFNSTGSTQTGNMGLYFTTQIENDALNGLNDFNGNPFNGVLFLDNLGDPSPVPIVVSTSQNTLPDGAAELQRERMTRSCTGGIVSERSLRAEGLTDKQIKDFFKEPMTVSFGVQGNVSMTDFATFFGGIRIYGD